MARVTIYNVRLTGEQVSFIEDLVHTYGIDLKLKSQVLSAIENADWTEEEEAQ